MSAITMAELATRIGGQLVGDGTVVVTSAAEPKDAGAQDVALAMDPRFAQGLAGSGAVAAVLWAEADFATLQQQSNLKAAILVGRARLAMAGITASFDRSMQVEAGIHPMAYVDPTAELGADVALGPFVCVGAGAKIGARSRIGANVSIGAGVVIGEGAVIHAGVVLNAHVTIGARFIAQPNAVVGGDGFSFVTAEKSNMEEARETLGTASVDHGAQDWLRIASIGGVVIGDDVEIGSNACVDQGTIRATRIGSGTKIDNQVQVGHNVVIGRNCLLCGQSGVAGSAVIGDNVVIGGRAAIADNLKIGDGAIIGGGAGVLSNVPAGRAMMGTPAVQMKTHVEMYKALRRLPRVLRDMTASQKPVSTTENSD
ncbi:UDP-3-O-acylglucosamine N-acyltransferase [Aquimixticola soesokkakensis]|uniref:UDP-3-O-acylglucosamine N-acyltransferase n=1 Tax=Aquimixticola soesokkakensis TaxID=1519096 RepID=A0A1Y5SFX9_9RHOB|nr:UDP-3-O-(3-hydroxymyristoyl)glucosamine N-acyltransferase [Aquimixticola soesokkakensis]SLN39531.1 UDP-3-O-acylglucosamine N-acyltransferase [Aquimixticola soesokkakensis]